MLEYLRGYIIPAAFALLPPEMGSQKAAAMLIAIGLQESGLLVRRQYGDGPARGFFQFERAGVQGVLTHPASSATMRRVLTVLRYEHSVTVADIHAAIEHNDVLAACLARCLLWTSNLPLGGPTDGPAAWRLYKATWRPGKPRPDSWSDNYTGAWLALEHQARTLNA